jgi:hypothetical protein
MACWFQDHEWGWPRRRGGEDIQGCVKCGAEQASPIQFRRNESGRETSETPTGEQRAVLGIATRVARLVRL